jgi:epsin
VFLPSKSQKMPITRQVKNVVKNYSNVEVKVREATSNDPWGPSSSLMADIADQTYNVVAFSEIMLMIWKRLNDHGKNWRHVYKSLVLLDYILKTGSERVAQQCRENIFAIQTLKDFQFIDRDGKDQGMNVREKSKQLVALLKDEERLKNERTRAIKAKERLAQGFSVGVGSNKLKPGATLRESGSASDVRVEKASEASPVSRSWEPERRTYGSEMEKSRPSNTNEEELQLQLALALSKQEADDTQHKMEKDEQRYQIALTESRQSVKKPGDTSLLNMAGRSGGSAVQVPDPWGVGAIAPPPQQPSDPWGQPKPVKWGPSDPQVDPWGEIPTGPPPTCHIPPPSPPSSRGIVIPPEPTAPTQNPWGYSPPAPTTLAQPQPDPWGAPSQPPPFNTVGSVNPWDEDPFSELASSSTSNDLFSTPSADPWAEINQPTTNGGPGNVQPFDMMSVGNNLPTDTQQTDLLADHSTLVNLDSLVSVSTESNPFFTPTPLPTKPGNPFAVEKPIAPSLNQLRTNQPILAPQTNPSPFGDPLLPAPLIPAGSSPAATTSNPFL